MAHCDFSLESRPVLIVATYQYESQPDRIVISYLNRREVSKYCDRIKFAHPIIWGCVGFFNTWLADALQSIDRFLKMLNLMPSDISFKISP
jgi:hypothetical protein